MLCLALQGAGKEQAQAIPLTLRVNHAIALGVDHLKRLQRGDGSFGGFERHPGGATALVAYTLVESGVRRGDPVLRAALGALGEEQLVSTYSSALHLMLCEALRDEGFVEAARASLAFLIANQDRGSGVWAYPWGQVDSSNTQFALLGLRAAARMGLSVPEGTLVAAAEGLAAFDHERGGFTYSLEAQGFSYAGITAAGLGGFAVLEELSAGSARLRSVLERRADARRKAEAWMEERWDPMRNHSADMTWRDFAHFAYLWAVERWCGLTGRARIGAHDWYTEGAEWLVAVQNRDGSFGREGTLEDTCFALLFLRRATVSESAELDELTAELERLRAARPERRSGPGRGAVRLSDWWLAGPWPQSGQGPILLSPPFEPKEVDPRPRGKIARRDWEPVRLRADQWTDLELLGERVGDRLLWLVAARLKVTGKEPVEACLWLELEEGWDVWLDGRRLSRERRRALVVRPDYSIDLVLEPGEHLLAVLVEDRNEASAFGALLSGRDGGAPPAAIELERHAQPKARGR